MSESDGVAEWRGGAVTKWRWASLVEGESTTTNSPRNRCGAGAREPEAQQA